MNRLIRALLTILAGLILSGCAGAGGPTPDILELPPGEAAEYRLGSGDQVRVIVYGEERLSGQFIVDGTGKMSLPLIGEVAVGGLTVAEFQQRVEAQLVEGFLRHPQVSAQVVNYRPYYILGEVTKPGEYPFTSGLTVFNAVATAEGFSYRANQAVVLIKHAGAAEERAYRLTASTPVQPGDTIRIKERYF